MNLSTGGSEKELTRSSSDGNWKTAEINILSCVKMDAKDLDLNRIHITQHQFEIHEFSVQDAITLGEIAELDPFRNAFKADKSCDRHDYYECEVELRTGYTHQIRLQFALCGSPIVGDTRYGSLEPLLLGIDEEIVDPSVYGPHPRMYVMLCPAMTAISSVNSFCYRTNAL
jgi:hypothetical protein